MMFASVSIRVMCLMVFFNQGIGVEDVRNVIGYIGESVVLPSDADPSWTLSTIRWTIYENLTNIALFQSKKVTIDRVPLFRGRLELNTSSGHLTIKNVSSRDALKYRVELVGGIPTQRKTSFVQLSVQEQLDKPSIHLLHSSLYSGYCVLSLGCLSMNSEVSLSWKPEHGFSEPFWSSDQGDSGESVLWTSFTPNRVVTFSCTAAADDRRQESSSKSVTCTEPEPRRNNTQPGSTQDVIRGRFFAGFFAGFITAGFITAGFITAIIYQKRKGGDNRPVGDNPSDAKTLKVNDAENPNEIDGQRDNKKSKTQEQDNQPACNNLPDAAEILLQEQPSRS